MHRYGNTAGVGAAACPAGGRRVPARILFALDPDAPEGPLYAPLPRSLPARFSGSIRQAYAATLGAALAAPPGKELDAVPSCPYANGPALPGGSAAMGADAALCAAWMVGASLALELLAGRAAVVEEPATPGEAEPVSRGERPAAVPAVQRVLRLVPGRRPLGASGEDRAALAQEIVAMRQVWEGSEGSVPFLFLTPQAAAVPSQSSGIGIAREGRPVGLLRRAA